jgi:hypothetical protein
MVLVVGAGNARGTDVAVAGALLGGVAYLVGYCHGWDRVWECLEDWEKTGKVSGEQKAESGQGQ